MFHDNTPHHPLARYGWDTGLESDFAPYAAEGQLPGRIVRVERGRCDVVTVTAPSGPAPAEAHTLTADIAPVSTSDPTRYACTGDWVALDADASAVTALLPRRTQILRSTSSKRSEGQVLAANVDHAVIAVSLAAELDLGRVERFLALAWESGAQPVVLLTKADLVPDPATLAHLVADTETAAPGVPVLTVSAETGEGIDALSALVGGGTTVLLGQSGAGKSTLANALLGAEVQQVNATRDSDGKGRHTTTSRDLLPLPLPGGGVLIDTPGLRGVGLWDAESGVAQVFAEIEELAGDCRFQDCAHVAEPGCAVLAAVDAGALPPRRLDSYRKLLRENERLAARTDARLRAELRRSWKQKQALGRHMVERKRGPRPRD
ncbi:MULTISPECIES: ribosome small subunit-dependent GTPase A [Streptomyces]|uniref:ribosome small subunit-dependent GTPase A n=1 Tax=Streptomyces TaxID=1883 RepID=UPI001F2395AE|nr:MULTISPECIES: ribosome small subunit-dependent GTPase A [Streptomyces]